MKETIPEVIARVVMAYTDVDNLERGVHIIWNWLDQRIEYERI